MSLYEVLKERLVCVKWLLLCSCSVDSVGSDQDGVPSKVSDSGVGGLESGEDSWISDTEVSKNQRHSTNPQPGTRLVMVKCCFSVV